MRRPFEIDRRRHFLSNQVKIFKPFFEHTYSIKTLALAHNDSLGVVGKRNIWGRNRSHKVGSWRVRGMPSKKEIQEEGKEGNIKKSPLCSLSSNMRDIASPRALEAVSSGNI